MRAAVIGASGQIGGWLLRILAARRHEVVGTYSTRPFPGLVHLDTADHGFASAWLRTVRPDLVFYPAGFTWVDGCERDPAHARAANLTQPLNVALATAEIGGRFVYFSTDYVFDGTAGPYAESDETHPLSVYGLAKKDAEEALGSSLGSGLLVVRTCWVYGPERQGKNFAYQVVRALGAGKPLTCPSDQISSPSYGPDVALAVVMLAEIGHSGLIHVAGPETIDRVAFARSLAEAFQLDPGLIVGRPTRELDQLAPRPLNAGLTTHVLHDLFPDIMRPLAASLPDFRAQLEAQDGWAAPISDA